MHMLTVSTFCAALALFLFVCAPAKEELANGDDPIAALGATVQSSRYGAQYWTEQKTAATELWTQAVAYCEPVEHADYPNCKIVRSVKFIGVPGAVENPARSENGFNP